MGSGSAVEIGTRTTESLAMKARSGGVPQRRTSSAYPSGPATRTAAAIEVPALMSPKWAGESSEFPERPAEFHFNGGASGDHPNGLALGREIGRPIVVYAVRIGPPWCTKTRTFFNNSSPRRSDKTIP